MYAKLQNGMLHSAPKTVDGKHYESSWEETDTEITQVWNLADDPVYPEPEPTPEERLDKVEKRTDTLETTSDDIVLMMADFIGGNE